MDENAYALGLQVATLINEVQHVRNDITELKNALTVQIPKLDERVRVLETAQEVWKARVATAAAIASVATGALAFVVNKLWG